MKVSELIEELRQCRQDAAVFFFHDWDAFREVKSVSVESADGHVVLGDHLPPELYARDFKDD